MKRIDDLDKNMHILVVDDYSSVRRVVKNCLAKLGFKNVAEAENGSSAIEIARQNKFNLIISDWAMPDMKVSDLLSQISTAEKVPCLMVVAPNQKKDTAKETAQEKSDYIVKPFTVATLEEKMLKVLS